MSECFDRTFLLKLALESYPKKYTYEETEFKKDVFRFFIIRKMIKRFLNHGIISEKLILNNVIISLNIFGISTVNLILRLICNDQEFGVIKSCLIFLNCFNLENDNTEYNQIMLDILNDIKHRYIISPDL